MAGTIKQQLQAKAPVQRITRTQRVAGQQEYARNVAVAQELQALKNKSDTIMQSSTPENYSEKYNQLDERIRQYYLSPNEYFTLPEVQKYQQEKKKYDDAIEDQKDYEMAQYYSNFAKMRKVSDFYMIVSFKEKATKRQLKYYNQIVAKDKALAEYYSPENVSKRKEVKLTPLNQAELIAVGQAMQLPTGKPVLVKNVNESDASYNYRLAQLGKSTAITQPVVTQQKLNTIKWQSENPSEVLIYDKSGNIAGVESARFSQSLGIDQYNKRIEDYNATIKTPEQLRNEAEPYLKDFGKKAEKFKEVTQPTKLNIFDYGKALLVSSPFGTGTKFNEEITKELTEERRSRLGLYVPYKESLDAIQKQKGVDIRVEKKSELFTELSEIVKSVPEELKYDVQKQGMNISVSRTGLQLKEQKIAQLKYDNVLTGKVDLKNIESTGSQIVITDKDFGRKISQDLLELEKPNQSVVSKTLLYTRIVSTKATEFYGTTKLLGFGLTKIGSGLKYGYTAIGGGLKVADFSVKGSKITATVLPTVLSKTGKISVATAKYSAGAGLVGLYGYQKIGQYQAYKQTSNSGKELFLLETTGEVLGMGLAIGEEVYNRQQVKKLNSRLEQENILLQQKKESLQNIQKYGQFSKKASLETVSFGTGKQMKLSDANIKALSKDYSKVYSISEKEAFRILKEKTYYVSQKSISGSDIPSIDRSLKYLKTGKSVTSKGNVYQMSRYGTSDILKTDKGITELTFEFNLKGSRISNVQLKTTVANKDKAITNIFEKTRASKKSPMDIWRLKETQATKVSTLAYGQVDDKVISLSIKENRLLQTYPYGKLKVSETEALRTGLQQGQLQDFTKYWLKAGKSARTSVFQSTNVKAPVYESFYKDLTPRQMAFKSLLDNNLGVYSSKYNTVKYVKLTSKQTARLQQYFGKDFSSKTVLKHEIGHAYQKYMNPTGKGVTFKKAEEHLLKKYGGEIPKAYSTKGSQVKEYLADKYRGEAIFKELAKIQSNEYQFLQLEEGKKLLPTRNIRFDFGKDVVKKKFLQTTNTKQTEVTSKALNQLLQTTKTTQLIQAQQPISASVQTASTIRTNLRLKQLLSLKSATDVGLNYATGLTTAQLLQTKTKQQQLLKTDLQNKQVYSQLSKLDYNLKQDSAITTKQATRMKLSTMQTTAPTTIFTPTQPIIPRQPIITTPPTPFVPFAFGFELPTGKQKLKDKLKKKNIESFALFPDFSSRMIGLKPKEYNEKQLEKEAMGLQTGFEIRRGGIVRKGRGRPKKAESILMKKMKVPKDMDYLKNTVKNALKVKW